MTDEEYVELEKLAEVASGKTRKQAGVFRIRHNTFRSQPFVNMDDDYARIIIDLPIKESDKLKTLINDFIKEQK